MRFSDAFLSLAITAFLVPTYAAPEPLIQVKKVTGATSGRHIVRLKPGVVQSHFLESTNVVPTHNWTVINGFAGELTRDKLDILRAHGDVESIAEDGVVRGGAVSTQTDATWGLARLCSIGKLANMNPNDRNFIFINDPFAGAGVDIYVVDTGVYIGHSEFGGRARWGATFGRYNSADGHGHGTHCAGTAAGSTVGVARAASVIAVKVVGDNNRGYVSDFIAGINWVYNQAQASGRPSVASLSLYADNQSNSFDDAITQLTTIGVHAVVAAGNQNIDATNTSPGGAAGALTVGASNIADIRYSMSNYGSVVDVFAPGENIISAGIAGPYSWNVMSGTSMAAPHVSGLVAGVISSEGNMPPADMINKIKAMSVSWVLQNIPPGTINAIAQNRLSPQ